MENKQTNKWNNYILYVLEAQIGDMKDTNDPNCTSRDENCNVWDEKYTLDGTNRIGEITKN